MATRKTGAEFVKYITEIIARAKGFEKSMEKLKIVDGGQGCCVAEFCVSTEHLNRGGGLHGGFTATLIDQVTTYALISNPCHPGVSVDLYVSYLKGAKEGDEIVVDAKTIRAGKKLAFIECELRHKNDCSIIAKGGQTKFVEFEIKEQ